MKLYFIKTENDKNATTRNILVYLVCNLYSKLYKLHLVEQLLPSFLSLSLPSSESETTKNVNKT
jgi:hypothetical protein